MRICVIYKGISRKKHGFEISPLGSFRGAEIYEAVLSPNISKRKLFKCVKTLSELKISFCTASDLPVSPLLQKAGIQPVADDLSLSSQIPEMALAFAQSLEFSPGFAICGGSFFTATRIALRLLEETSAVYVTCADFEAVAEACCEMCGAVINNSPPPDVIEIYPTKKDSLIRFRDTKLGFSDFTMSFCDDVSFGIPDSCLPALVKALELCGFLRDNDIKIQLLPK